MRAALALVAALLATAARAEDAGPVLTQGGFDAAALGEAQGYPIPGHVRDVLPGNIVGFYSHYDGVVHTHAVPRAGAPTPFKRAAPEIDVGYTFRGQPRTLQSYPALNPVTGLLVARGDTILFEHYQYARTDTDRFLSQSMAKTVTGMLVGIAVSEHAIHSIDDPVSAYVPELAGTEYGVTPLRALLHMSSGVAFHETYQPGDDNAKLGRVLFAHDGGPLAALRQFDTRDAPPGTRWSYSGAEAELLGLVVSRAVHTSLADYLSTRIWQKMGMESDAAWAADPTGQEVAYCCLVATLRDWARLGLMMADGGAWNGQQVVPRQWVLDATSVAPGDAYLAPGYGGRYFGYGYQLWLLPGARRAFAFMGIHGQRIFVDPGAKLVMVQTAVFQDSGGPALAEATVLWRAVDAAFGTPDQTAR